MVLVKGNIQPVIKIFLTSEILSKLMNFLHKYYQLINCSFWYLGLAILFIFFTTSLQTYRPQVLRLSWYIYPLFMPTVILSAIFISTIKIKIRSVLLMIYFCGSLVMCNSYRDYFQKSFTFLY